MTKCRFMKSKLDKISDMPKGIIHFIQEKETTGMWHGHRFVHTGDQVMKVLQEDIKWKTFGEHVDNLWDCEDRAFMGAAYLRCMLPGQPTAVALGIAVEPFAGQKHAVIVFWAEDRNGKFINFFFDPEASIGRPVKVGDLVKFNTKKIVPFPAFMPHEKHTVQKVLPPFDNFSYANGALVLDREYTLIDSEMAKTIVEYIKNRDYGKLPGPKDPLQSDIFWDFFTCSIADRVLWAFAHARQRFKGYAIGMALGTLFGTTDHAAIVLFGEHNDHIFVDIGNPDGTVKGGKMKAGQFEPRILIV